MLCRRFIVAELILLCYLLSVAHASASITFGAVQYTPHGLNSTSPAELIQVNTNHYIDYVSQAADAGVDVVVFPEGTLGWIMAESRDALFPYCATFPDQLPQSLSELPNAPALYRAVQRLAEVAQNRSISIVINVCDQQVCQHNCRSDGWWLRNAQLVLNANGELVAKYYKSHLFTEASMFDVVRIVDRNLDSAVFQLKQSDSVLPIGLLTCFDMEFAYPAVPLQRTRDISHFILSSWWVNTLPLFHAAAFQQAFSRVTQSTLIASNTGAIRSSGGGIWHRGRPLVWYYDDAADINRLLIASVPVNDTLSIESSRSKSVVIAPSAMGNTSFPCQFWLWSGACVSLTDSQTSRSNVSASVTHRSFTCSLWADVEVSTIRPGKSFYSAFAFEGDLRFPNTPDFLRLQICAMLLCEIKSAEPGQPVVCSNTTIASLVVHSFQAYAEFNPGVVVRLVYTLCNLVFCDLVFNPLVYWWHRYSPCSLATTVQFCPIQSDPHN
jgi:predicted amidohydrolase